MTLRNVPKGYTLEQQRQEVNLIAVDVDDIDLTLETRAKLALSVAAEPSASGNGNLAYDNTTGIFTYTPPALTLDDITDNGNTTTNSITVGGLTLNNNIDISFGTSTNATLGYSTSETAIRYQGYNTDLKLSAKNIYIDVAPSGLPVEYAAKLFQDGGVELYYNGSKKFETTTSGITVTGSVLIDNSLYVNSAYPGIGAQILETGAYRSRVDDVSGTVQDALVLGRFQNLDSFVVKADGNLTTVGDITANKLVKSGGTSSQFLKADGSTDSSTYLTTESDPVFSASEAASITSTDTANWDTAYGWGDHGVEGYLTSETDTLQSVTDRGASSSNPLTFSYAGQALTLTGASSRLDVQNGGTYAISLNSSTGINTNQGVGLYIGNYGTSLWRAQINGTNGNITTEGSVTAASLSGSLVISGSTAPTTASSTGTPGEIRYDASFIYVCIATNTWKRAAISTWP